MVLAIEILSDCRLLLSVLALSSRFDGRIARHRAGRIRFCFQYSLCRVVLMVRNAAAKSGRTVAFQYSLCRVVLMVRDTRYGLRETMNFQYSLCRVVLMVEAGLVSRALYQTLSVLALSSRFDGPHMGVCICVAIFLSVLALSSRFDGQSKLPNSGYKNSLSVLALSSRFDGQSFKSIWKWICSLSVLALSSRFDGLHFRLVSMRNTAAFSTRSVESF